jgi:DNA-3-methyladenine glycosylase II
MSHPLELSLPVRGPFSLTAFRNFQCGLMVASRVCDPDPEVVRFAFPLDGAHTPVGVEVRSAGDQLRVKVVGTTKLDVVGRQVARILSVDHDGTGYAKLLASDPALARVAATAPGFRPPVFYSPYAAAGWLVLGHRVQRAQATRWQAALAEAGGDVVRIGEARIPSFPSPKTLLARPKVAGIPDEKWLRLQAVARAALEGRLELERLASLPTDEAHAALRTIHGIGPWTADGVLFRGCGLTDAFFTSEPQVHHAAQLAYGLDAVPDDAALERLARRWRPFRTWVSVLLTMNYYNATGGRAPTVRKRGVPGRKQRALELR